MDAIKVAQDLIRFDSVSSRSNEPVSRWVADFLANVGFDVEWLSYRDGEGVTKVSIVAKRSSTGNSAGFDSSGESSGGVAYIAHTDVVPAGDWSCDFCGPFEPTIRDDRLYGRGACDMKGSLACALAAVSRIDQKDQTAPIYFVVTADEEVGMLGALHVNRHSTTFHEMVTNQVVGIVGEPTMLDVVHSHKGGVAIEFRARGKSAHSSTRDGINANHQLIPILPLLLEIQQLCENDTALHNTDFTSPTLSWNIVLRNEPFASNVTPSLAEAIVFARPMPGIMHQPLVDRVLAKANELGLEVEMRETKPFYVDPSQTHIRDMLRIVDKKQSITVCYATDASALQRMNHLMICGPGSIDQAHRSDEWISIEQLHKGTEIYHQSFLHWACDVRNG